MLSDYNGWSGRNREAAEKRLRAGIRLGLIDPFPADAKCCMCGQSGDMWHCEEYGPTAEDYRQSSAPVCYHCHGMIHLRFRFPGLWTVYVNKLQDGWKPPVLKGIFELFQRSKRWKDHPPVPVSGEQWWARLTTDRYRGPRKELR